MNIFDITKHILINLNKKILFLKIIFKHVTA